MKKYYGILTKNYILIIILLWGALLRLYNLGSNPLWMDEIRTFHRTNGSLTHTLTALKNSPYPPLYYLFMNIWVKFFGSTEFALRFPSFLASVLSIIIIYFLTKELFNKRTALIAAFLLALSPYALNYAQEAKNYSLFWFFGILSFLLFIKILKDKKSFSLYIISLTFSILTSYLGILFLLIQLLHSCLFDKKEYKKYLYGTLAVGLLCLFTLKHFLATTINKNMMFWVPETPHDFSFFLLSVKSVLGLTLGKYNPFEFYIYLSFFLFGIYLITKKFINQKKNDSTILLTWFFIPLVLFALIDSCYTNLLITRLYGFIHLPLLIIIALGINHIARNKFFLGLCLFVLTLSTLYLHHLPIYKKAIRIQNDEFIFNNEFHYYYQQREDWREVAQDVCKSTDKDSTLFITKENLINFSYYADCYKGSIFIFPRVLEYSHLNLPLDYYRKFFKSSHVINIDPQGYPFEKFDSFLLIAKGKPEFYYFLKNKYLKNLLTNNPKEKLSTLINRSSPQHNKVSIMIQKQ